MIDLEHLTEEERSIIMGVLQRDEQLRQAEEERVKERLKTELHDLRRKSAIKVDDGAVVDSGKVCARCHEPFGSLFGSGEICTRCQHKVCSKCKVTLPNSKKWLCTVCNKMLQIRLESGEAFGPHPDGKQEVYGTDLIKLSLGKTAIPQEPTVLVNGGHHSPAADSGFHGRGRNESVEPSLAYDDEYTSDNSYEQSMASAVESIGPSVSQRGSISTRSSHQDDGTIVSENTKVDYDTLDRTSSRDGSLVNSQGRSHSDDTDLYAKPSKYSGRQLHDNGGSELSEDERSYRSQGSDGRGGHGPPGIPTIAIHDTGDGNEDYDMRGSGSLHRQALEGNMYRDPTTAEWVTYSNGSLTRSEDEPLPASGDDDADSATRPQIWTEPVPPVSLPSDDNDDSHPQIQSPRTDIQMEEFPETPSTTEVQEKEKEEEVVIAPQDSSPKQASDDGQKFQGRSAGSTVSSPVGKKLSKKNMLHKGSSSSLTSLYSTGEEFYGKYPITGDVSFALGYNFKTNVFEVKIGGCRDLVPIDAKKNKSDPYIKTYLLPDKSKNSKRKTKTKKGTINPNYSENLRYPISQSELETRTLSIAVWHYDRFGHNMFLGEVLLPLDSVDVSKYPVKWHQLKARVPPTETKPISYKGDIQLALMFETLVDENKNSATKASRKKKKGATAKQIGGNLKVHVKEAKNLVTPRIGASINPYIKLYLLPDRSKNGKKKTSTMKNTCSPTYEQTLEFPNVTEDMLRERALEIGIWDDAVGSSTLLGGVRLGSGTGKSYGRGVDWQDANGIEIQLWEEMLANQNQWVEADLTLRPSFDKEKRN